MTYLTGAARLAGVTGWPISQSKSPRMHGHWLDALNIDGAYLPFPISPDNFTSAIHGLKNSGLRGLNVTAPHKEAAFEICNALSQTAQTIGSVNTLVFNEDGTIFGDSTDGYGFIQNIRQETKQSAPSFDFTAGNALVLGAGGAAKAIVYALLEAGVSNVVVTNRTNERAVELAQMNPERIQVVDWDDRGSACENMNFLVNTTALGMQGKAPLVMPLDKLPTTALVTDIVYVPLATDLLVAAQTRGNPTVDGIGMLLHQAVRGFSYWFGETPEVTDELRALMLSD